MHKFYFNECLPHLPEVDVQIIFENMIHEFNNLCKNNNLEISREIITHTIPTEIIICEQRLSDLIKNCSSRELRNVAFGLFSRCRIGDSYDIEDIFTNETIGLRYKLGEYDAENVAIASLMGWIAFSLPICESLKTDELNIKCDDGNILILQNWYGKNNEHIVSYINAIIADNLNNIEKLKKIFTDKICVKSSWFDREFNRCSYILQVSIIEKFSNALEQNLIFPPVHKEPLVKHCTSQPGKEKNKIDVYELRSFCNVGAVRVYFNATNNSIYLGGMGSKAKYEGNSQNDDLIKATKVIKGLKN